MKRELSAHAKAAKAIRAELKAAFKGVKFSVTSQSFSMGDSVSISWTDGPTISEVDAITDKYEYSDFDSINDTWNFKNRRDDIPQTKFVLTHRSVTE